MLKCVRVGTKIYLQWIDTDGLVSPIYVTKTYDPADIAESSSSTGLYGFAIPKWVDAKGTEHILNPDSGQQMRVWFEPYTDPLTGNRVVPFGMSNHVQSFGPAGSEGNYLSESGQYIVDVLVSGFEEPGIYMTTGPQDKWRKSDADLGGTANNSVRGKVWFERGSTTLGSGLVPVGDTVAQGYSVVFSALTAAGSHG